MADFSTRGRMLTRLDRGAATLALAWLAAAAATLAAATSIERSALHRLSLPPEVSHTFMARELVALAVVCSAVSLVALLLHSAARASRSRLLAILLHAAGHVVVAMAVVLIAGSWLTFRSAGVFLDAEAAGFAATNLAAFARHIAAMEPWVAATAPLLAIVAVVLFSAGLPRLVRRLPGWSRIVAAAAGAVLLALVVWRANGVDSVIKPENPANDAEVGMVWTRGELVADTRDERSGPLLHLIAAWNHSPGSVVPDPSIPVAMPPLVPLQDWVAGVDRSQIRRSNVLIVLVESLRPDMLRSGGSTRSVMPAVDRLAEQGRVYTQHYAQSSHSNYADLCALNGHYPLRSQGTHIYPPDPPYPRVLLWDLLRPLGWRTAIISSQDERWGGMLNYLTSDGLEYLRHAANFEGPTYVPRGDTGFEAMVKGEKRSGKIDDRFTVDEAIRWIDSVGDDPFIVYLNLQSSHLPYETPADFPRRFGSDHLPFVIRFNDYPRDAADQVKDQYANSLAYLDHQFGRLVEHLERSGRLDDTLVIVTGDNGEAFYEHGFAAHANSLYEEVLRVPLILRGPGVTPGLDARPAQHVDVPPTMLELLGLPPHPSFQGVSLAAALPDSEALRDRFMVAQCPAAHQVALVRGRFKLIHDVRRGSRWLLDLVKDPRELADVSRKHPQELDEMTRRLDTWHYWQLAYYRDARLHGSSYPPRLGH